jgi:hypothetical protein
MINEYKDLLENFSKIYKEKSNKQTIFEISGFPHWENVSSNVLAFFFNPTKEHKLDDLLIKSLCQSIDAKITLGNLRNTKVFREYSTKRGGRLDILILNENFVIGIENKIYAGLNNDLKDYSNTIEQVAENNGIDKGEIFKIVLSFKDEKPKDSFINVTYSILFKNIRNNIADYVFDSDNKYLSFLFDFITTFEKPNYMDNNEELLKFFEQNSDVIDKLLSNYNELNDKLVKEFRNYSENAEIKESYSSKVTYRDLRTSWGVYRDDFTYKKYAFNLQFAFSPTKGLTNLYIWSNGNKEKEVIKKLEYDKEQNFKPTKMDQAKDAATKMIKKMLEELDKQ